MRNLILAGSCLIISMSVFSQTVSQVISIKLNAGKTICTKVRMSDTSLKNYCWGRNVGRMFLNDTAHSSPTPILMNPPAGVTDVTPGGAAAYGTTGVAGLNYSWGNNLNAELGQGSIGGMSALPQKLNALPVDATINRIIAGVNTTCATDQGGSAWCWGKNNRGQLGAGYAGSADFAAYWGWDNSVISAKTLHVCSIKTDGKVYCAGANPFWQLGYSGSDSYTINSYLPETTFTQVSVGFYHTCGIYNGGQVKCWGMNRDGQLGDGTKSEKSLPVDVVGLTNATFVRAGRTSTCALTTLSQVFCWGSNLNGQLGTWEVTESLVPRLVPGLSNVVSVQVGDREACAISSGQLYCWGSNEYGQLAQGDYWNRFFPAVVNFSLLSNPHQVAIFSGYESTCSIATVGPVRCWGANDRGQLGTAWTAAGVERPIQADILPANVTKMAMSNSHSCYLTSESRVFCWGENGYGELGNGTTVDSSSPVEVLNMGGTAVDISAGRDNSCALLSNGQLKCWGANWHGQLGIGTGTGIYATPQLVPFANSIVSVSASRLGEQTCAADITGKAYCWGSNYDYELGQDNGVLFNPSPVEVPGINGIVKVATGELFGCAVKNDGKAYCWGQNWGGQTGGGDFVRTKRARLVRNLSNVVDIQLGGAHACALTSKKKLFCWGAGSDGQLGNDQWDSIPTPTEVMSNITSFSVTRRNTCAVDVDENVYCWGKGDLGQNGIPDSFGTVNIPTKIELKK